MKASKRTEILKIRLTKKEKRRLHQKATQECLTMSGYVRRILAEPPDITKEQYEHLKTDFIYEIRKIGVNINQIAKKYNEYAYTEPSKDLMDKMERISDLARTVTKSIEGREG